MIYGISAVYDINGDKAPNVLSNCTGKLTATSDKTGDCSVKQNRLIKDRFSVRLRGGIAVPNGQAARWAYNN
jgi:hypothetical protein